jgi:hypothetical protein
MPINLRSAADFWGRIFGDSATPGDGTSSGSPARFDQYNNDIGQASTTVSIDGDLQNVDTAAERLSTAPAANSSGAASTRYTSNFLLRWITGLNQDVLNRLPSALVSGRLSVDGSGVTQPISGTVTANLASGTNNIGDIDVLTVPAPLSTTGNGTAATALRVTVASDSTGVVAVTDNGGTLSIDDGAGSITVDGTVTANLGTIAGVATETTLSGLNTKVPSGLTVTSTRLLTDGSGVTQPVRSTGNVFNSDLTLDTSAYAAGDSFCTLLTVTGAVLTAGDTSILDYIHIVDVDDVGPALRLYFFDRSVTLPANNAVWNVSDADMKFSRVMQQVNVGDWSDAGGNRTTTYSNLGYLVRPNSGTSVFMAAIIDSATTHTAAGINISIGFKY